MENIYHIYPLGYVGANMSHNDGHCPMKISSIIQEIPHMKSLGTTMLLLGPVFQSTSHGYDTEDYRRVDHRLGSNQDLRMLVEACHDNGIKVMLDAVLNHVSRNHPIFENVLSHREDSPYKGWIKGLNFHGNNGHRDGLSYETWDGHEDLVKLDQSLTEVQDFLLANALYWLQTFDIDALRLDAADVCYRPFLKKLSHQMKAHKEGFLLLGEVVHGDYRLWLDEADLDMVTNYEAYKGLYSSLNDVNYYEIAYSLNRQFGQGGIYPGQSMVNFVDNHDVNRIIDTLSKEEHLYPLHIMLYTMPGNPCLYYGSEHMIHGKKASNTDKDLRPSSDSIRAMRRENLMPTLRQLVKVRENVPAIGQGEGYCLISNTHDTIAYKRSLGQDEALVIINSSSESKQVSLPGIRGTYYDHLDNMTIYVDNVVDMHKNWGRILVAVQ